MEIRKRKPPLPEGRHVCEIRSSKDVEIVQKDFSDEQSSETFIPFATSEEEKWKPENFEIEELVFKMELSTEIYKVKHIETGEVAFLKVSRNYYQYQSKYLSEEYIWRKASPHPNIVNLYSAYLMQHSKCYVFEYLSHGTLRNFMKIHKVLQTRVAQLLTAQITSAIMFIHGKNIFHRHISNRHILLNADGQAKLSEFSHALVNKTSRGVHGSLFYQAPEIYSGEIYDRTADWYSLGVCLYEMVMGMTPAEYHCKRKGIRFKELDYKAKIVVMLTSSVYIPKIFPKNLKEMLEGLLKKSTEDRFGYRENTKIITNHPFFCDVDWEEIESGSVKVNLPSNKRTTENSENRIHSILKKRTK